jgi:short-subunit dehydrogenase
MRPATLVTGASSGLGAEFARACAKRGDEVVLVARRRDRLEMIAREIGERAHILVADLAASGGPANILEEMRRKGLFVDTLINNAGFGLAGNFAELPLERQAEMVRLNVEALTLLTHLVLPSMMQRATGAILNVASTAAFQPGPGIAVYFASKAYVLSFTEALHQELRATGIKVSALCPGPTATEFGKVAGVTSDRFARLSADAAGVVAAGLAGLSRNRAVVVPGFVNKLTAQAHRLMPRAAMRWLVAAIKL